MISIYYEHTLRLLSISYKYLFKWAESILKNLLILSFDILIFISIL